MENITQSSVELLTTDEAAEYLRLSARTLEHWRETGEGPSFYKLGRSVRYTVAEIEAYLAQSNFHSTSEASKTSRYLSSPVLRTVSVKKRLSRTRSPQTNS